MDKFFSQIILFIAGNAIGAMVLRLRVALGVVGLWRSLAAITVL